MSRLVNVAAAAVCAAALSACGTGLQAQTYKEVGRQDGVETAGAFALRLRFRPCF